MTAFRRPRVGSPSVAVFALLSLSLVLGSSREARPADAKGEQGTGGLTIHQEVDVPASPGAVYHALLDGKEFSSLTGASAEITGDVGGSFRLFDGRILGRIVELVPSRRVVEAWRSASWPEGVYSIARFELVSQGTGTRIVFDHTGFPPEQREHLAMGWEEHYWKALRTLK